MACPRGTFQPARGQFSVTACTACSAGTFGSQVGATACRACQGSSNSEPGASSCECLGLNRIYLREVGACVCKSGHVPSDGTLPDEDSDVDCQKMVFERCETGAELDANGVCRGPSDCSDQCDGSAGTLEPGLGVCRCENSLTAKEVCDSTCRAKLPQITFNALGDIEVTDKSTEEILSYHLAALGTLAGGARCQLSDPTGCRIVALGKDPVTGDFLADFQPPAVLGLPRRRLHSSRYMQGLLETKESRALQAVDGQALRNPVVCAGAGSAVLFDGITPQHYPVYQKNSLLNTNDGFDFGAFVRLGDQLAANATAASSFLFLFEDPGVYVFRDSGAASKETIIAILGGGAACPSSLLFEAKSYSSLLQVGASMRDDVALSPDWSLFLASCLGFFVVIILTAVTVSYIYNKNWDQDPTRKSVRY